ncbi:MAG TPA: flavodoxin family protein [Methanolinea sp.]|nr:flavodoxin family protein [Methanolinea sp.]HQK56889.1 flavodoxin family protein [Methanolinea sp.]
MKGLDITGSRRKGNTHPAAERIRENIQEKALVKWEYVILRDLHLTQFRGCANCIVTGEEFCPVKDDMKGLSHKMHDADGMIFALPVCARQLTDLMKVVTDRLSHILHRRRFSGKKRLIPSTAGALEISDLLNYRDSLVHMWGSEVAGKGGTYEGFIPWTREQDNNQNLGAVAEESDEAPWRDAHPNPGLMDTIAFHGMRVMFDEGGEVFPTNRAYPGERRWMQNGASYLVDVPVNPVYHAVGFLLEIYPRRQIRKNLRDTNQGVSS